MTKPLPESDFILFLRHCCFETIVLRAAPARLMQIEQRNLQALGYFYLAKTLPAEYRKKWGAIYRAQSLHDVQLEYAYRRLQAFFLNQNIRYCPLKGADLSWRVYPVGSLRNKCDLDILVHPADCDKAWEVLQNDGWKAPYQYRHDHHYPAMTKNGVTLELHFNLPNFEKNTENIWNDLLQVDTVRYQVPLELNLLMLFHHCRHHRWSGGIKLLLDYAFLLKQESTIDWQKLNRYVHYYGIASPQIFFEAFPDFFPEQFLPSPPGTTHEISVMLRNTILFPFAWKQAAPEIVMSSRERFRIGWWRKRLKGMSLSAIRLKTHNPEGNYGKLLLGFFAVGKEKVLLGWRYRHGSTNQELQSRLNECEQIEKFLANSEKLPSFTGLPRLSVWKSKNPLAEYCIILAKLHQFLFGTASGK